MVLGARALDFCNQGNRSSRVGAHDESLRWVQHTPENAKRNDEGAKRLAHA